MPLKDEYTIAAAVAVISVLFLQKGVEVEKSEIKSQLQKLSWTLAKLLDFFLHICAVYNAYGKAPSFPSAPLPLCPSAALPLWLSRPPKRIAFIPVIIPHSIDIS
jgi:hypothetical protein